MKRHCLKCNHINEEAQGGELEACPACGAIYSRVAAAEMKKRQERQAQMERNSSLGSPSRFPRSVLPAQTNGDIYAFADELRSETLYPTFRELMKWGYFLGVALAAIIAIGAISKGLDNFSTT